MSELESPGRAPASTREKTAENSADRSGKRGDTRARLMEAAERLFGERGLHAVTLKEINAAAGQRNESALHYHFGSKARLVDAILNTRVAAIDRVRVQRVEALVGSGREGDIAEILRATFEPLTGLLDTEEGVRFVRFAAQVLNDPDRLLVEMVLTSLAIWTRRPDAMTNDAARSFFVSSLFDAMAGALTAPVSEETLAALRETLKD
jgi:AcrR family transcriptional regulator